MPYVPWCAFYLRGWRSVAAYVCTRQLARARVFVLARGWIVTTAGDTRLNTPTIVTTDTDTPCFHRAVISVTILPLASAGSLDLTLTVYRWWPGDDAREICGETRENCRRTFLGE